MARKYRVFCVANKRLPANDYRLGFRKRSKVAVASYGLPDCPHGVETSEFVPLEFKEGVSPRDACEFAALLNHLRKNRQQIDLAHFFSTKLQLFGPWCARMAGVACIITITGFGRTFNRNEWRYRMLRPVYFVLLRLAMRLSRAVFFQNHGEMRWLQAKLPHFAHKMHWIGSGVEADVVTAKDFQTGPLRVLFVGRLMPDKGVPLILEAAKMLSSKIEFTLVGPPSAGAEWLLDEVIDAEQAGHIRYLGELDEQQLAEQYRDHHVFTFPSHGEGMPRVMLEAGHGLLCPVASDISAHRDLVADGRGKLLESGNELESLTHHLRQLERNRSVLSENAHAYQRYILGVYTVEAYTRRLDAQLARLLQVDTAKDQQIHGEAASLRPATQADLTAITAVHASAFPGFFMTRLGPAFLRAYYRHVIDDASGIALVAESPDAQIQGFVVGFIDPTNFYRRMRSARIRLLLAAAPRLICAPRLLRQMFGSSRRVGAAADGALSKTSCELSSIGVAHSAQSSGLGKRLTAAFNQAAEHRGARTVSLTTDADDNEAVNRFYQTQGFQITDTFHAAGNRRMHRYTISLVETEAQRAA